MTKKECEQLQEDIITYCDGLDEQLISDLCQIVLEYYLAHKCA